MPFPYRLAVLLTATFMSAGAMTGCAGNTSAARSQARAAFARYTSTCGPGQFVGNRRSRVLHYPSDSNLPSPRNQVCFNNASAGIAAGYHLAGSRHARPPGQPTGGRHRTVPGATPAFGMSIPGHPTPREVTYLNCGPAGSGSEDPYLNLLKNRVDIATHPTAYTLAQFIRLPWPHALSDNRTPMTSWNSRDRSAVYRYEGTAITLEGYLVHGKQEGPESPNCEGRAGIDWHLWIASVPRAERGSAVIVESTPRVRAELPGFNFFRLTGYASRSTRVRVTGWTMLDYQHPEQVGSDRATLWEVHPITRVQIYQGNSWLTVAGK